MPLSANAFEAQNIGSKRHIREQQFARYSDLASLILQKTEYSAQLRESLRNPIVFYSGVCSLSNELSKHTVPGRYKSPPPSEVLLRDFISWFYNESHGYQDLKNLMDAAREGRRNSRRAREKLIADLALNRDSSPSLSRAANIYANIRTIIVPNSRNKDAYPRKGIWISDNPVVTEQWKQWVKSGKLHDSRTARKPLEEVDLSQLNFDLGPDEDAYFIGEDGTTEMLVIRDFCPVQEVAAWVDKVVRDNINVSRSIRLDDAGSLTLSGWSAGSRSQPLFAWAKNIIRSMASDEKRSLHYDTSAIFALLWNLAVTMMPDDVLADFEDFIGELGIYRMDPSIYYNGEATRMYTVRIGGVDIPLRDAELAPPCGVCAKNYARFATSILFLRSLNEDPRCMHTESQPHRFAISWTTGRDGSPEEGGHFYNGRLRIRVQGAANTLVIWKPEDVHGTSLQNVHPDDSNPKVVQTGLAIVTSSRISSIFSKYKAGQLSEVAASKQYYSFGEEVDDAEEV
ncbi:hypothetical protein VNI00_018393 [Paramarasmius palmivorus]|uniref:Uncharacterized protein n=1 Tax=Paramarasmius palmivorus TaxID=297713 RepID=A0AAW0AYZ6_9AGAR